MLEVAEGMKYLHSEGIIHGDLHGVRVSIWCLQISYHMIIYQRNVLLNPELHCQITDFGSTRHFEAAVTRSTTAFVIYWHARVKTLSPCQTTKSIFLSLPASMRTTKAYASPSAPSAICATLPVCPLILLLLWPSNITIRPLPLPPLDARHHQPLCFQASLQEWFISHLLVPSRGPTNKANLRLAWSR